MTAEHRSNSRRRRPVTNAIVSLSLPLAQMCQQFDGHSSSDDLVDKSALAGYCPLSAEVLSKRKLSEVSGSCETFAIQSVFDPSASLNPLPCFSNDERTFPRKEETFHWSESVHDSRYSSDNDDFDESDSEMFHRIRKGHSLHRPQVINSALNGPFGLNLSSVSSPRSRENVRSTRESSPSIAGEDFVSFSPRGRRNNTEATITRSDEASATRIMATEYDAENKRERKLAQAERLIRSAQRRLRKAVKLLDKIDDRA